MLKCFSYQNILKPLFDFLFYLFLKEPSEIGMSEEVLLKVCAFFRDANPQFSSFSSFKHSELSDSLFQTC